MTDAERAERYRQALCAVVDRFSLVWRNPEGRAAEMYGIAIEALAAELLKETP